MLVFGEAAAVREAARGAARRRGGRRLGDGRDRPGSAGWRAGSGTGCSPGRRSTTVTTSAPVRRTEDPPLRLLRPLPSGVTLLEASAGTGKTFTIAALAARWVAEGTAARPPPHRDLHAHGHGRAARAGAGPARHGRRRARAPRRRGAHPRRRPRRLLADGSADEVRSGGPARQGGRGLRRRDDRHDARLLPAGALRARHRGRRRARRHPRRGRPRPPRGGRRRPLPRSSPPVERRRLRRGRRRCAVAAGCSPSPRPRPAAAGRGASPPAMRRRFAEAVSKEMDRARGPLKILTYDDVLLRLRDTLADPSRGAGGVRPAARALRRRPRRRVPGHRSGAVGHHARRLRRGRQDARPHRRPEAGDLRLPRRRRLRLPRGEGEPCSRSATLDVNWRSDQGLLDAYDALFEGAQLGQAGITYRHVNAAPRNGEPRLLGAPVAAPLRVRVVHAADRSCPLPADGERARST